jgi:catechol 2,3-dioxygenase-like lactoylglutathione lyase family enzyme
VLHHLTLWVPDLERATTSWTWLLGRLGFVRDPSYERVMLFRHEMGYAFVLEQSADMVPGMLYSRFRPGLNHVAFSVASADALAALAAESVEFGWAVMTGDRHGIAGGAEVVYLEDRDGFEVELVAPLAA